MLPTAGPVPQATEAEAAADGVLVVDKPGGLTSHQVVARIRRIAGTRKVGHGGTLDPMATGVLVVGLNRATRLLGHLSGADKSYTATVRLGAVTDTDDADGSVVGEPRGADDVMPDDVRAAMPAFTGDLDQVPSSVSAIKVDGKRAYARVRAGEQVTLAARRVRVDRFDAVSFRRVEPWLDVTVEVDCSTGTYVRALARDLGTALGCGGHLTTLRRTRVGAFDLAEAHTLEDLTTSVELPVVGIGRVAETMFARIDTDTDRAAAVRVGRPLDDLPPGVGVLAVFGPDDEFLALYDPPGPDGLARPKAVFVS